MVGQPHEEDNRILLVLLLDDDLQLTAPMGEGRVVGGRCLHRFLERFERLEATRIWRIDVCAEGRWRFADYACKHLNDPEPEFAQTSREPIELSL